MDKVLFHMFSDDRFMDLTLYQYGYEQCLPLHSYGPFVRNHFLFHYVISGKGTLLVDDENSQSTEYQLQGGMGFLIEPDRVNTYFADRKDPWEYAWIEFSGLRAKETVDTINADNSVLEGIRTVNKMLTKKKIRIYKENCPMLVKEMQSYAWDEKAIQNGGREKPIKVNDHSVDALRYYCQTVIRSRRLANA